MIPATPVGEIVARGETEIGFQQIAELHGVDQLGPIPAELQKVTIFSSGVVTGAHQVEAGKAFIAYLPSPRSSPAISETGSSRSCSRNNHPTEGLSSQRRPVDPCGASSLSHRVQRDPSDDCSPPPGLFCRDLDE
jgi:hypothetical protein